MSTDIKREFIHATYSRSNDNPDEDLLLIKEHLHHPDGTITNNLKKIYNYQRDFYTTKKEFRDHEQKKEFEFMERLDKHTCTTAAMPRKVFKAIHGFNSSNYVSPRDTGESVYVYGTDISTPVIVADMYSRVENNPISEPSLAIIDYETDVINDTGLIISGSITMRDHTHLAVTRNFLGPLADNVEELLNAAVDKYIPEYKASRNLGRIRVSVVDRPADVTMALMSSAHKWQPDYLGGWNIGFDVKKMIESLELVNIPPASVFSDPSVPDSFKSFYFREDKLKRVKANGMVFIKGVADLWHTMNSTSSFALIDLMSTFKLLRVRESNRSSYSLDAILNSEIKIGKLRFSGADGLTKLEWHKKMQSEFKIEYLLYNLFDCISLEMLDEHTGDIKNSIRAYIGISELEKANANPKRLSDAMHFNLLDNNKVLTATARSMRNELDKLTPACGATKANPFGWITTLSPELTYNMGRSVIKGYPLLPTNITAHAVDIDVESAYPSLETLLNISVSTRLIEICQLTDVSEYDRRTAGMNLSSVNMNSISLAKQLYNYPDLEVLLADFTK